jgi:hypothetical protein
MTGNPQITGRPQPGSWAAVAALYVALIAVKPLYIGIVAIVPYVVRFFLALYEDILGAPIGNYRVRPIWLVGFVVLTVLTAILAAHYATEAAQAPTRMAKDKAARFAMKKLAFSWFLLDSISFYGVVSKVLRYSDMWCYGFVGISMFLTIAAGWPLLSLRRETRQ